MKHTLIIAALLVSACLDTNEPVDYSQTVYFDTIAAPDNVSASHPWFELSPNDSQCTYQYPTVTCVRSQHVTEVFYLADDEIYRQVGENLYVFNIIEASNSPFRSL